MYYNLFLISILIFFRCNFVIVSFRNCIIFLLYRAPLDTSLWLNGLPCLNKVLLLLTVMRESAKKDVRPNVRVDRYVT